jgi:hypothetical protein
MSNDLFIKSTTSFVPGPKSVSYKIISYYMQSYKKIEILFSFVNRFLVVGKDEKYVIAKTTESDNIWAASLTFIFSKEVGYR